MATVSSRGGREGGASGEVAVARRGRALAAEMREEESVRLQHLLLAELGWTSIGTEPPPPAVTSLLHLIRDGPPERRGTVLGLGGAVAQREGS